MAVATSAMLRTWPVRLDAIELTLSVRSFQVPATPGTSAWPPSLPSVPTSRATRVTCSAKTRSVSTSELIVSESSAISPFALTVIFCDRSPRATAVAADDPADAQQLPGVAQLQLGEPVEALDHLARQPVAPAQPDFQVTGQQPVERIGQLLEEDGFGTLLGDFFDCGHGVSTGLGGRRC